MSERATRTPPTWLLIGGLALALAVGLGMVMALGPRLFSTDPAAPALAGEIASPRETTGGFALAEPGPGGGYAIASGQTLELAADALPDDGPLVLELTLGEPEHGAGPLDVRVIAFDRRLLYLGGAVDPRDRRSTRIEVDPEWLVPGRYVVEVKTSERTHIPLRRYAVLIRPPQP